jgi:hypothetical protein
MSQASTFLDVRPFFCVVLLSIWVRTPARPRRDKDFDDGFELTNAGEIVGIISEPREDVTFLLHVRKMVAMAFIAHPLGNDTAKKRKVGFFALPQTDRICTPR